MELDDHLKKLMKDLGVAINDALSDSLELDAAIRNVREAGFDVFLVLEATIGLNRRPPPGEEGGAPSVNGEDVELKVNAQDVKFLRSLKIKVDDLDSQ